MKKPKLEKITRIKNRLRKLRDQIVRARDENRCQRGDRPCCTKRDSRGKTILHVSHIYPVGLYPWLEFDPDNCKLLCFWCHFRWWHIDIIGAAFWVASYLRGDRAHDIIRGAAHPIVVDRDFLYEKEAELLMYVDMMKAGGIA
jgi:hypothetical protein